ncbi:dipeptidase PepV [Haploplasma axanthum]|uniref:Dipeptidase SA1572 n=1 Tax=Haploplasma axanthum TaxID=29552 RepID=A0A449BEF6_HAPAX|nr:dipeptidase PepV [Haploplasma axanthum]VEU80817.1 Putative dipeptidase SA1572 [Haploplasma axanthum]
MKIDFKAEVLKRKDDLIKDLQKLIQINSELTTFDPNRVGAPFGEGNKEALDYMLSLGNKDGFETLNVDGYAGHIEYGKQNEFVGIIGHLDVVPAGSGWSYPAYGAEIHDGKMFGRGTEDDKGPTIAAYYALKILKELNVPLSKRVKLVLGIDEESGWRCVNHYFKRFPEAPVSGFIPDADFPLIYAEKGIVRINIEGKYDNSSLVSFTGGLRDNMVPDHATAIVKNVNDKFVDSFEKYLKENNLNGNTEKTTNGIKLDLDGISAHGSLPELGKNAIHLLNDFLIQEGIKNELTILIDKYLTKDTRGNKLGINYHDDEMGDLTVNLGVLEVNNNDFKVVLNVRYPNGVVFDEMFNSLKDTFKGFNVSYNHHQKLLYNDPNSELVQKLMTVYRKHTNDVEAKPITIGGGTFARAMPNVVAFGPHFLGKPSYIHQKDEYIEIDDLILATIIYTEALYELAK